MIKKLFPLATLLLLVASCANDIDQASQMRMRAGQMPEFYATIEGSSDAETKVFADSKMRVLWNADDRISIFNMNTGNMQFAFTGEDGSNAGGFKYVSGPTSESSLDHIYAVYSYAEATAVSQDGAVSLTLPATQTYKENSFGIGANTMISVTDDNQLRFKNVGGYLSFRFYGDNVSIKSITLQGNNHEKLAGKAKVTMPLNGTPILEMQNDATESITLTCESPVSLGATKNDPTEFWFVLPPTDFTQGITVTVLDVNNNVFEMNSASHLNFERNKLTRLSAKKVVPVVRNIVFEDASFKTYCVNNYDTDHDGEISLYEATLIKNVTVCTDTIASLKGIEFFTNLRFLTCNGTATYNSERGDYDVSGQLTSLNIDNNTALTYLCCENNHLTALDVSRNTQLSVLRCYRNHLTHLNVANNKELRELRCFSNLLSSLNVANNEQLSSLFCSSNQLSLLDVSNNKRLEELGCGQNQLTNLDLSSNPTISYLYCDKNPFTEVVFPPNLETILRQSFANCDHLNDLTIPASVKTIDQYAFSGCTRLMAIRLRSITPPTGGQGMFNNTNDCPIYVPKESIDAYKQSEYWSDYADRIQADSFSLTPSTVEVEPTAGSFSVKVNAPYCGYHIESMPTWVTHDSASGDKHTFSVSPNTSESARSGIIVFCDDQGSCLSLSVKQWGVSSFDWTRSFSHKSLVMRFTATWCGWCPRMNKSIAKAMTDYPDRILPVALHTNGSKFCFESIDPLETQYNISEYPSGIVDGRDWIRNWSIDVTARRIIHDIQETEAYYTTMSGIRIASSISGRDLTVDVDTYVKSGGNYKISIFLLEDGIVGYQADNEEGAHNDYVHDNVARLALTDVTGEAFSSPGRTIHSIHKNVSIPAGYNIANMRILVFTQATFDGKVKIQSGDYGNYYVDNCATVAIGESLPLAFAE